MPLLGAGAGERLHPRLVGGKLAGRPGIDHVAVVEHIGVVGDFERHAHILLDQGKFLAEGTPQEIAENKAVQTAYLGQAA